MRPFLSYFAHRLRLAKPWNYKVPSLLAIPYFMVMHGPENNAKVYVGIAMSYITIIGLAGLAYLLNDLGDRKTDAEAGKQNALIDASKTRIWLLALLFGGLALAPWLWFPLDAFSWMLLSLEVALFGAYALPPFRLKERGILGVIADALYAHLLPALLAANTFYLLGGSSYESLRPFLIALGFWQFFLGLRNILFHQISDETADRSAGVNTLATRYGFAILNRWITRLLLPLEVIGFLAFGWFVQREVPWFLPGFGLFIIVVAATFSSTENTRTARTFSDHFLDRFYNDFFPLLLLSGVIVSPTEVWPILLAHLLFFKSKLTSGLRWLLPISDFRMVSFQGWLFGHERYLTALGRNLAVWVVYTSLFIGCYFLLEYWLVEARFLFHQKQLSWALMAVMGAHLATLVYKRWELCVATFSTFLLATGSAINLALIRIIFMAWMANEAFHHVSGPLSKWAELPASAREPLPFLGWFIELVPISTELYSTAAMCAFAFCMLAALGVFTRISLLLSIPFAFYVWAVPCFFGKLNHNQLVLWIPLILALSPSGDALSIDSLFRTLTGRKKDTSPAVHYGLPLKFIWLQLALIYGFSGAHKLFDTGLAWALSDSVIHQLHTEWLENYSQLPVFRIDHFPWLVKAGGFAVMFGELFYPLLLFHPLLRPVAFFWGQAFHRLTAAFLYIDFEHLRCLSWSYIPWRKAFEIVRESIRSKALPSMALLSAKQTFIPLQWSAFKSSRMLVYVGGSVLFVNAVFSLFGINTWPLSSYPTYSAYIGANFEMIHMKLEREDGSSINHVKLGEEQNFQWENFRLFERAIIDAHAQGDGSLPATEAMKFLTLWQLNVQGLEDVSQASFYRVTVPVSPEHQADTVSKDYIGSLHLSPAP